MSVRHQWPGSQQQVRSARDPLSRRDILIGLMVGCLIVAGLALRVQLRTEGTAEYADPGWDRHLYIAMAGTGPFDFGIAPYNRRVLVPAVARVIPGDLQTGFALTTMTFAVIATAAMYVLGRARGHSPVVALAGTLLVASLGWGLKYAVADFWIPDATVLAFVTAAFIFATRRMPVAFAACLAVGVLAKESVIFVVPLFYTLNTQKALDRRLLLATGLTAAPAVLLLLVLRLAIPAQNGDSAYLASLPAAISRFPELYLHYDYLALLRDIGYRQRVLDANGASLLEATIRPYGPVLLAWCVVSLRQHWRCALRVSPFVLLVYVQLLFATDTERLLVLAAPALCCLAMSGMEDLADGSRGLAPGILGVSMLAFAGALIQPNSFDIQLRQQAVLLAIATPVLAAMWWRARDKRPLFRPA